MKAEWVHSNNGLTLQLSVQSDIDRVNMQSFVSQKPEFKPRLRVTEITCDVNKKPTGMLLAFVQNIGNNALLRNGWNTRDNLVYKAFDNVLIIIEIAINCRVKRVIFENAAALASYTEDVINALINDFNITTYDGFDIQFMGHVRTTGDLKVLLRMQNI
jgi:hypothetical protein